jgi:hypothetical protein
MAVAVTGLDITGSGSKGTKVHALYQTTDAKATVKGANYFDALAEHMARVGSITIYASDATFQAKVSISAGVVTIAALDAFA